ncbi:GNAT family N-acetyltransferase [Colwellia sp. MEBiC06753]
MAKINWQIYPITAFSQIAQPWNELNNLTNNQAVLSASFIQSLINVFATGDEVIVQGFDGQEMVFAGIFKQMSARRWMVFQPSQAPLGALLSRVELSRSLLDDISKCLPTSCWLLDITQIDSAWFQQADIELDYLPYITTGALNVPSNFDDYFASLSKNTRQNINKAKNRLAKEEVAISLTVVTKAEEMAQCVTQYGELESKSWKNNLGTAVSIDNEQGRFYLDLLQSFAQQQCAQVWCYRFNDTLVAIDLCIVHGETLTILKTTFDETYARYSPALLLKVDAYQWLSSEQHIKRIEYFGKVMDWHKRLQCEQRALFHITYAKSQGIYRTINWLKNKLVSSK